MPPHIDLNILKGQDLVVFYCHRPRLTEQRPHAADQLIRVYRFRKNVNNTSFAVIREISSVASALSQEQHGRCRAGIRIAIHHMATQWVERGVDYDEVAR